MSYTPTVWNTGDVITAEKLNHAEEGIKNAFSTYVVNFTLNSDDYSVTCDKTYQEIDDATYENVPIAILNNEGIFELFTVYSLGRDEATNKRYYAFKRVEAFDNSNQTDQIIQLSVYILRVFEDGTADYHSADTLFE